ncbi:hypothetical protein ACFLS5_03115 [Candidatus Bipolaricaulota bacterium]
MSEQESTLSLQCSLSAFVISMLISAAILFAFRSRICHTAVLSALLEKGGEAMLLENRLDELREKAVANGITATDINPLEIANDELCAACCAVAGGT